MMPLSREIEVFLIITNKQILSYYAVKVSQISKERKSRDEWTEKLQRFQCAKAKILPDVVSVVEYPGDKLFLSGLYS